MPWASIAYTTSNFTFYDNDLEQVNLNQLQSTGCYGSFDKNQLETIDFPKTFTSIGRESFANNKLITLDIHRYCGKIR